MVGEISPPALLAEGTKWPCAPFLMANWRLSRDGGRVHPKRDSEYIMGRTDTRLHELYARVKRSIIIKEQSNSKGFTVVKTARR